MLRSLALTLFLAGTTAHADPWTEVFTIEKVPIPPGIDPQIGGLTTLPSGKLAMCFHRGEVLLYDPESETWSQFAEGLHEPLGILAEDEQTFVVMQRPELTRLRDTDGDGTADQYETIFDGFGMTGNYHEFAFGPARDKEGNYYISLNVASNGAGIREEIRGEWHETGLAREKMLSGSPEWKANKGAAGRMYARVPYRGWVLKVSPDGKSWEPYASGFRSPEGIGFDRDDRLLVTDNQGDWLGTSKLHHVRKDHFHGHVASLIWRSDWDRGNPLKVPVGEIDALRTPAMGLLPQGELANSPTEPITIPPGVFGPLAGQTLIGEMNQPSLVRFLPDTVGEVSQGAAIPFLRSEALGRGNHRLTFTPDGSLWIGKTHLSWAGAEGLFRVRLKSERNDFLAVETVRLTEDGFMLRFTQPVDEASLANLSVYEHSYHYHAAYGSPKVGLRQVPTAEATLAANRKDLAIHIPELKERYVYTIDLTGTAGTAGQPLLGDKVYYTLVKKR